MGSHSWAYTLLFGFIFQVVADDQKTKFKMNLLMKANLLQRTLEQIKTSKLFWRNCLWAGLTIICILYMSGFQYVALISPVFAFLLIYFVSGVRMLEDKANKKWGKDFNKI